MRQVRGKRTAPGLWKAAGVCVVLGSWQTPQESVERGQETPAPPPPAGPKSSTNPAPRMNCLGQKPETSPRSPLGMKRKAVGTRGDIGHTHTNLPRRARGVWASRGGQGWMGSAPGSPHGSPEMLQGQRSLGEAEGKVLRTCRAQIREKLLPSSHTFWCPGPGRAKSHIPAVCGLQLHGNCFQKKVLSAWS